MSKITVDAETVALLKALPTKSELIGPDGRHLGFFIPLHEAKENSEEHKADACIVVEKRD